MASIQVCGRDARRHKMCQMSCVICHVCNLYVLTCVLFCTICSFCLCTSTMFMCGFVRVVLSVWFL